MAPRSVATPAPNPVGPITPDLAMVLQDAKPHPQLGAPAPRPPSTAQLGNAAAAIAADLAVHGAAPGPGGRPEHPAAPLDGLRTSYLLPPGTRARVHRAGPSGVLLLAPSGTPRAVAMAGPGLYVVVEVVA
jgi:hypothetical protein